MPLIEVPLTGNGIAQNATCPISVVDYTGPDIVPPFKPVKLSGVPSYGLGAGVTGYQWSAEQPAGGNESFSPNSQAQLVQFTPVVTGQYLFKLKVFDANGQPSCNTASTSVLALPEHDVFIELLWYTPGDPDPTDSGPGKGTDLDLHLLSPKALGPDVDLDGEPDGWFDPVYDCYPANKTPNWGKSDPAAGDDPILLRADSDGIGPESIAFNKPADAIYKVGVHYVNDSGFGDSFASIRIYIHQGLAWQSPYFKLAKGDLWDAARISVDGIDVQADAFTYLDGSPVVIPNYPVPK
jgi:hypothetical protein